MFSSRIFYFKILNQFFIFYFSFLVLNFCRSIGTDKFNVFDVEKLDEVDDVMVFVGRVLLEPFADDLDMKNLPEFLRTLSEAYAQVAYHNNLHGVDVANGLVYMSKNMGSLWQKASVTERLACIIGGLGHDVG